MIAYFLPYTTSDHSSIDDDSERSKWRRVVENVMCQLKRVHRLAMRFEKTDISDAAMIDAASACLAFP